MNRESNYTNGIEIKEESIPLLHQETTVDNDIFTQLERIVATHTDVTSYAYIKSIHDLFYRIEQNSIARDELMRTLNKHIICDKDGIAIEFITANTRLVDFTIYYCLSLYCKRKNKTIHTTLSLETLINKYGSLFDDFPLALEIRSWYARRTDKFDKAYIYDKRLIQLININVNAGVYNSFASSICSRLESEFKSQRKGRSIYFWRNNSDRIEDWQLACSYMPNIISNWKKVWGIEDGYGKHYFIHGKLLLFAPDYKLIEVPQRLERLTDAKRYFEMALSCENSDNPDYNIRCEEYKRYLHKCEEYETDILNYPPPIAEMCHIATGHTEKNKRFGLSKPNEDYYILDPDNNIYLIADGVTRPHEEYINDTTSIAADCARVLCETVYAQILQSKDSTPEKSLLDAMIVANDQLKNSNTTNTTKFIPCATFIGVIIREKRLFFSNCCDTIGLIIRDNIKIKFTEHHNHLSEIFNYTKEKIYSELHNNIANPMGFGIFNGDNRLTDFLNVSHIDLKTGDRVIIASDGLCKYLESARATHLHSITIEDIFEESKIYDTLPFQKYADDKTCIIIDI